MTAETFGLFLITFLVGRDLSQVNSSQNSIGDFLSLLRTKVQPGAKSQVEQMLSSSVSLNIARSLF